MSDPNRVLEPARSLRATPFTPSGSATTSEPTGEPLLKAADLACRRGGEWLFEALCFEVRRGQALWLRGPNGSGKTSLLRIVAGLLRPDAGHVIAATHGDPQALRRQQVYIGHANALKDDLTAFEALGFLARLHGRESSPAAVMSALRRLAMDHRCHAMVRTLSQGQRRRVALARLALERVAGLWLLDEPFDALDAAGVQAVDGLLEEHLARGGGVLLTSHVPPTLPGRLVRQLILDTERIA